MKSSKKKLVILEAAKQCFSTYGYEKTTLDDIGKKLGLNKSSLYYYFKNKEEIFTAVVIQEADKIVHELHEEMQFMDHPEDKILHYMGRRLNHYRRILNLHQLTTESILEIQPDFTAFYEDIRKREVRFIALELRKLHSSLTSEYSDKVAGILLDACDALKHDEVFYNRKDIQVELDYNKIESKIGYLVKLILNGLRFEMNQLMPVFA
jgi:AcrR family transcriptional regulator